MELSDLYNLFFKTRYETNISLKAVSYIKLGIFSKSWLIFFQLEFNP